MDRQKFIDDFLTTSPEVDPSYIENIVQGLLKRLDLKPEGQVKFPDFERGCKLMVSMMEESAELIEAISQRLRGRTDDNYSILEESADVVIDVLCALMLFGNSTEDLLKAIEVKCERMQRKMIAEGLLDMKKEGLI